MGMAFSVWVYFTSGMKWVPSDKRATCLSRQKYKKSIFCNHTAHIPSILCLPHKSLKSTVVQHSPIFRLPYVRLGEEDVACCNIDGDEPKRFNDKTQIVVLKELKQRPGLWVI